MRCKDRMELSFPTSDQYFVRYVMLKSDCKKKKRSTTVQLSSKPPVNQSHNQAMQRYVESSEMLSLLVCCFR